MLSPSSQRVWIEIDNVVYNSHGSDVTLFTEGVDWNRSFTLCQPLNRGVTLFTEGVDWNSKG